MSYPARTPAQLGQVLKGQRKLRKLTQQDAAAKVGLLPKTISRLELAPEGATIESLFKLLAALDLELLIRSKPSAAPETDW